MGWRLAKGFLSWGGSRLLHVVSHVLQLSPDFPRGGGDRGFKCSRGFGESKLLKTLFETEIYSQNITWEHRVRLLSGALAPFLLCLPSSLCTREITVHPWFILLSVCCIKIDQILKSSSNTCQGCKAMRKLKLILLMEWYSELCEIYSHAASNFEHMCDFHSEMKYFTMISLIT